LSIIEIIASDLKFPEAPAFDRNGNLWCVEMLGGNLNCWINGIRKTYPTDGAPNGLVFDNEGNAVFCDSKKNEIRIFYTKTQQFGVIVDNVNGKELNKPNDLAYDFEGNLVFTCPGNSRREPTGYVCCLNKDGETKIITSGMYFPNGLLFIDNANTLIIAETYRHCIWKGDWDSKRNIWVNSYSWVEVGGPIGPDGMALGPDGLIYVAVYGTGQIKAITPEGEIVDNYYLPGNNPTNVAFDPTGKLGLVITEAEKGLIIAYPELVLKSNLST
jgi:gluconolactonase